MCTLDPWKKSALHNAKLHPADVYVLLCSTHRSPPSVFLRYRGQCWILSESEDWNLFFYWYFYADFKRISTHPACLQLITSLWGRGELSYFKQGTWFPETDLPKVNHTVRQKEVQKQTPTTCQTYTEAIRLLSQEQELDSRAVECPGLLWAEWQSGIFSENTHV